MEKSGIDAAIFFQTLIGYFFPPLFCLKPSKWYRAFCKISWCKFGIGIQDKGNEKRTESSFPVSFSTSVCTCVRVCVYVWRIQTVHGMQAIKLKNDISTWKVPMRELGHFCLPADVPFSPAFWARSTFWNHIPHFWQCLGGTTECF